MAFRDVIANPPTNLTEWNRVLIKDYGLHVKFRKRLRQMFRMHKRKRAEVAKIHKDHIDFPDYYVKQHVDNGMSLTDAQAQVVSDRNALLQKRKHITSILKCLRAEHEIRELLIADGRYITEPNEDDIEDDATLEPDTPIITSINLSITRNPIG